MRASSQMRCREVGSRRFTDLQRRLAARARHGSRTGGSSRLLGPHRVAVVPPDGRRVLVGVLEPGDFLRQRRPLMRLGGRALTYRRAHARRRVPSSGHSERAERTNPGEGRRARCARLDTSGRRVARGQKAVAFRFQRKVCDTSILPREMTAGQLQNQSPNKKYKRNVLWNMLCPYQKHMNKPLKKTSRSLFFCFLIIGQSPFNSTKMIPV